MRRTGKRNGSSAEQSSTKKESKETATKEIPSQFFHLFGFHLSDFSSWGSFQRLLHRPTDPSSLGVLRILYGLLMVMDIPQERGMSHADYKWGDEDECRFPLFDFLSPLPIAWMYVVYLIMWMGALGIMLGLMFRVSCLMFACSYWYVFLLDKTVWNNHSYLYGLCSLLLLFSDANRYWSLDGLWHRHKRNAHVPLWNYTLFRSQFFLVYFIAGLKKLDADWVTGYSMQKLSEHWVFDPFTWLLSNDLVDLWVVHRGGLAIDLFIGYILFFDKTRIIGIIFGGSFHLMNSQIFSIGMFPWMMLATMPIFCHVDWPRRLFSAFPQCLERVLPLSGQPQKNPHCLYSKEEVKPDDESSPTQSSPAESSRAVRSQPSFYHRMASIGCVLYLATQCFLPYSHFVTKGYNNWTNGLYGYSWDMMVHSWSTQHIRITYVDKDSGKEGYLNPDAWTRGGKRWCAHADMVKQYARCIEQRLKNFNITRTELYFDVWRSLNDRFQQRMFDPTVDILTADWHPFKATPWLKPLLTDLSDWRERLDEIEKKIYDKSNITDVTFIADFPGLTLENFIQGELNDTKLTVLKGQVTVDFPENEETAVTLSEGQVYQIPANMFHNVRTISDTPSCLMYVFRNTTEEALYSELSTYEQEVKDFEKKREQSLATDSDHPEAKNPEVAKLWHQVTEKKNQVEYNANLTAIERAEKFLMHKYRTFTRGFTMVRVALQSIIMRDSFESVFNRTLADHDLDFFESVSS
ncbi:hypothetical protein CAPTEDRAFT_169440 [Capitella teleta]|uniref:Vitamin K-dependent gamma-carboxylase n=1 Tax=Capitella teleta TaxID=283909 RepID=R7TRE3_CAPTE|nr:hypothetical protein CAPTEDRAFT_169440 [Capitella teleta]|eukprot:ELT96478.1 hypothetical protein CAPTEDRAFT_169440 [Capitella teleta]